VKSDKVKRLTLIGDYLKGDEYGWYKQLFYIAQSVMSQKTAKFRNTKLEIYTKEIFR
jgi:hypothetical protein